MTQIQGVIIHVKCSRCTNSHGKEETIYAGSGTWLEMMSFQSQPHTWMSKLSRHIIIIDTARVENVGGVKRALRRAGLAHVVTHHPRVDGVRHGEAAPDGGAPCGHMQVVHCGHEGPLTGPPKNKATRRDSVQEPGSNNWYIKMILSVCKNYRYVNNINKYYNSCFRK